MSEDAQREITFSTKLTVGLIDEPTPDIDRDERFTRLFHRARQFSMTSKPAMYALYESVRYLCERQIDGAIVECGVWRGGSSLLAALTCREMNDADRIFYLYDTFDGMTPASELDLDDENRNGNEFIDRFGDEGRFCYVDIADVRSTFVSEGLSLENIRFIKGDVMETIPVHSPDRIALLRLDTDWHTSTKLELEELFPRLVSGGVLIIDDYGHWSGARKAVDDYFAADPYFLHRIDSTVRLLIKR